MARNGNPSGDARCPGLAPGALSDPEGLTRIDVDGGITLVMSSSLAVRNKTVSHDGLVRVRYTPDGDLTAEDMPGFRDWVVQQHPELAAAADLDADDGGLNIEGVAWDPVRGTLLFGIRSPVTDAGIPVLRVRLDPAAPWTTAALERSPDHLHQQNEFHVRCKGSGPSPTTLTAAVSWYCWAGRSAAGRHLSSSAHGTVRVRRCGHSISGSPSR